MQWFNRVRSSIDSIVLSNRCGWSGEVEHLESRTLLSATLTSTPPAVHVATNSAATSINLNNYFDDNQVPGKFVLMQTNEGEIPIALSNLPQIATTVNNFVNNYVTTGEYNGTIIHRVITAAQGGIGIVQGGGYTTDLNTIQPLSAMIPLQYDLPNAIDTIAMARTSVQNSATSGWFFNAIDNSQNLGPSNGGGYAVFGNVLYNVGAQTINTIYNLQQTSVTTTDSQTQSNFPVNSNYTGGTPTLSDYVVVEGAAVISPLTFGASTDNNQLVTPSIASDGTLTLTYAAGQTGTAHIIVNANDFGGNVATTTFTVNVGGLPTTPATIGKGAARVVHFTDPDGVAGTATLIGPGNATLTFTGAGVTTSTSKAGVETVTGTPQSISIDTTGTSAGSVLNVTGAVTIAGISTDGNIGSISGSRVSLTGGLSVAGTAGVINLAAANGGTISVAGQGRSLSLNVGSASGESATSAGKIAAITSGNWTGGGSISAQSISRIAVKQELNANVSATTLGSVSAGSIISSTWAISGNLSGITAGSITGLNLSAAKIGAITDRGAATGDTINSSGNVGIISALSLTGTRIYAGGPTLDAGGIPTTFAANDTISAVVVGKGGFSNSIIGGGTLLRVNLGAVTSANGGTPFGVAAHKILSLTATVDGKRLALARATSATQVSAALTKAGITLNDLVIRIV